MMIRFVIGLIMIIGAAGALDHSLMMPVNLFLIGTGLVIMFSGAHSVKEEIN